MCVCVRVLPTHGWWRCALVGMGTVSQRCEIRSAQVWCLSAKQWGGRPRVAGVAARLRALGTRIAAHAKCGGYAMASSGLTSSHVVFRLWVCGICSAGQKLNLLIALQQLEHEGGALCTAPGAVQLQYHCCCRGVMRRYRVLKGVHGEG